MDAGEQAVEFLVARARLKRREGTAKRRRNPLLGGRRIDPDETPIEIGVLLTIKGFCPVHSVN